MPNSLCNPHTDVHVHVRRFADKETYGTIAQAVNKPAHTHTHTEVDSLTQDNTKHCTTVAKQ